MAKWFKRGLRHFTQPFSGYFSQLLTSLILLFIFRPYDRGALYMGIWQILFVLVFLSAIFNCNHSKRTQILAACFGCPAFILQSINLFVSSKLLVMFFLLFMVIFVLITTSSIISRVVLSARVKLETLRGVVCAYFMVAFGFTFVYFLIDLIIPGSFHIAPELGVTLSPSHYLSEMMYFSFVTLLSIGYGDITAVKDIGQTFTILEGIVGQFYIAILVARLVSVYSFFEHQLHLIKKPKTTKKENKSPRKI